MDTRETKEGERYLCVSLRESSWMTQGGPKLDSIGCVIIGGVLSPSSVQKLDLHPPSTLHHPNIPKVVCINGTILLYLLTDLCRLFYIKNKKYIYFYYIWIVSCLY